MVVDEKGLVEEVCMDRYIDKLLDAGFDLSGVQIADW